MSLAFPILQQSRRQRLGRQCAMLALAAAVLGFGVVTCAHLLPQSRSMAKADVLSPFALHVLIGGLSAALALWLRRWEFPIMIAAVALALLLPPAMFYARMLPVNVAPSPGTVRIYALNVWDQHPDFARLEAALFAIDADVLVLSEIGPARAAMLKRLSVKYPHTSSCANTWDCSQTIVSRLPIVKGNAARPGYEHPPIAMARVDASSRGAGIITVVGTHVHRPTRHAYTHLKQMQNLKRYLLHFSGPLVVAGDFNASRFSATVASLKEDVRLTEAMGFTPTWPMAPAAVPQFEIDHILLSQELVAVKAGSAPATGSDHAALYADVALLRRTVNR